MVDMFFTHTKRKLKLMISEFSSVTLKLKSIKMKSHLFMKNWLGLATVTRLFSIVTTFT